MGERIGWMGPASAASMASNVAGMAWMNAARGRSRMRIDRDVGDASVAGLAQRVEAPRHWIGDRIGIKFMGTGRLPA